jgi:demethylmenaquinone methyltransferase/2-methoxy-6-polyprenyl-1,4-benzoquinol methylase
VIPRLGSAVGRNREAYQYLVESIRRFPDQARLRDLMRGAGFQRVSFTNFAGGVCALHQGWAI